MSATITPKMVSELREKTGAGMSDCKKALTDANGDMEGAVKILREKGVMKAAKRADRSAMEGIVGHATTADGKGAALAEVNCETDFAARSEKFQQLVAAVAKTSLANKCTSGEALLASKMESGKTVADSLAELLSEIGEKLEVTKVAYLEGDVTATYIHPPGKIGVVVAASGTPSEEAVAALRDVAMHIAAFAPKFLDDSFIDAATLEMEKEIAANIARNEGKPENIIPKIVEGKMKSFAKDNCLVSQPFAKDPTMTVAQYLAKAAPAVKLTTFARIQVGEGKTKAEE